MRRAVLFALVLPAALFLGSAQAHDHDHEKGGSISHVNGGITAEAGESYGDLDTVNGGISVRSRAIAEDVETVNGGIHFDFNSRIGGDIETVNGGITLKQSEVGGRIQTVQGDITVGAKSVVRGGILVEKPHGIHFGRQRIPRIVIGPEATVQGTLRFDREVELFVHPSAKIGTVVGAKAQTWTDKLPPRRDD